MSIRICGNVPGIDCVRFPNITTNQMEVFIKSKINAIIEEEDGNYPTPEVYCFPQRLGDESRGIRYAVMCICMSGVTEEDDSLYGRLKPFNYRPRLIRGIQNAIVRGYGFDAEKLQAYLDKPSKLKNLCLKPKDIDFLWRNRKLKAASIQGKPYYMFYADMDRILDDFLQDADTDDYTVPNYTVLNIKALGDKPDSPLSYDIILNASPEAGPQMAQDVFKALVSTR